MCTNKALIVKAVTDKINALQCTIRYYQLLKERKGKIHYAEYAIAKSELRQYQILLAELLIDE